MRLFFHASIITDPPPAPQGSDRSRTPRCAEAVRPPGVDSLFIGIEEAVGIGEAAVEQSCHLAALLVGEARVLAVGLGVLEVDLAVSDVEVAAEDHGLGLLQLLEIRQKSVLPCHAVIQTAKLILRVRRIAGHGKEIREFRCDHPSLVVMLLDADTVTDRKRLLLGEHRRARISLLFGVVPVGVIPLGREVDLPLLKLCLLQTENVRVDLFEKVLKPLCHAGSQTVDVP